MRPLVLIHGYSASGVDFAPLRDKLCDKLQRKPVDINIANYVSLNNEVTIKDIAEGLDRAFRHNKLLEGDATEFDAIVHSTGTLVIRAWLTNYGAQPGINKRVLRLKHLIGLAPATWGSPQAHKGRTWLGALVKGNRKFGPDFLNAGNLVLDNLELGSSFTWNLAHADLLGPEPYYDTGTNTPFVAVFIGNTAYKGLAAVANDPGTDGTVRWAGCALNTRKIRLNLTRNPVNEKGETVPDEKRIQISDWADKRLDIPMIAVNDRNHGTLVSDPEDEMVGFIKDFLNIGEPGAETYKDWINRAKAYSDRSIASMKTGAAAEGWQQFVVRCIDEHGDGISDYIIEVSTVGGGEKFTRFEEMYEDVHAYGADRSFRCFHIRLSPNLTDPKTPLWIRLHASTGTDLVVYQGYLKSGTAKQLTADSSPIELDLGQFSKLNGTIFFPFTTTLVEIVLNREPWPLDGISKLLTWWKDPAPAAS